jgi:quercetin dioxygenase-like cupin family protein
MPDGREQPSSAFDRLGDLAPQQLFEGFVARSVHGEQLTLAVVEIEPNAVLPEHEHVNEQFGMVLRGSATFRVGEESRELRPGDIWRIPAHTLHTLVAGPEGAEVLDVFSPPRDDWRGLAALAPQQPRWP